MGYTRRAHHTDKELTKYMVQDLITDIRFSTRKIDAGINVAEEAPYRDRLKVQLVEIFKNRHTVKYDQYGWPRLESFRSKGGPQ